MVKSARPDFCGDFLLFFGDLEPPGGRTGRAWRAVYKHQESALWCQNASETWRGAPFREVSIGSGRAWLFGELWDGSEAWLSAVAAGERSAELLNGHFLFIVRDDESGEWAIHTDRLGTFHAYVARRGGRVAVGSSFRAVAGAASARRLDWTALAGFFRCGFFPADLTPYDDVSILRPARRYVFSPQGELRAARRYWSWRHRPTLEGEEAVERFGQLLGQVVGEMAGSGRLALPLSGGLDSRSLLAALPDHGEKPWSFSYGYGLNSAETRIAARLARKRRLPFGAFRVPPYLFNRIHDLQIAVEGFQDLTQSRQAGVAGELGREADFVLGGHWGDVWMNDMGLLGRRCQAGQIVDHAFAKVTKRGGPQLAELLCRKELRGDDPGALTRQIVQREIQALGELDDADFLVKAFKTDQWSARFTTASLRAYQLAAFPRLPFYDNRLVDFFTSVGSAEVRGRRLQIAYLKRFAPDLAGVAWQETGVNLNHSHWPAALLLPLRALHKTARLLHLETRLERNWEAQLEGHAGRKGLEHWLLRPALRLHDFLAPAPTRELLENFWQRPDPELGYQVSMLLTFSVFLESS